MCCLIVGLPILGLPILCVMDDGARFLLFGPGRERFDPAKWSQADVSQHMNVTRLRMVDDLLERHPLTGLAGADVARLLGAPDERPDLLEEQPRHRGAHIYRLGPDHLGIDSLWLVIAFDDQDRVASASVVSD